MSLYHIPQQKGLKTVYILSLKGTHCLCKLILHWQPIRMVQPSMSYQERDLSGVTWWKTWL
jgi:hypothetical protein